MDREGGVLVLSGAVGGAVQLLGDFPGFLFGILINC